MIPKLSEKSLEEEEAVVACELCQLPLFIYLINSGILWIKRSSSFARPDLHDRRSIVFGESLVRSLTDEYRRFEKGGRPDSVDEAV